jgi:acetolactate synthase-1/2/3 large subunit
MHGGDLVAEFLLAQGTPFVFTLTGGHIAPILAGCRQRGIRVIDTRHEATAVFAADATARLTGRPGVAVVTAGPGVTNTLTAVKNAQMAQSPVVLIGGAAATALKGRGALQDIDQLALFRSVVKWSRSLRRVRDLVPALEEAFQQASAGVPGPVFVEIPIDLLYDEALVRQWYGLASGGRSLADRALKQYLRWHVGRIFGGRPAPIRHVPPPAAPVPPAASVGAAASRLAKAQRPVIVVGSQAMLDVAAAEQLADALARIGAPVYLSGMARGLLGRDHPLHMRHRRREALREADLVLLAGVPCDFRLDYGRHIPRRACYLAANRSQAELRQNRRPDVTVHGDASLFVRMLAEQLPQAPRWETWRASLRERDQQRDQEIAAQAQQPTRDLNPLHLCRTVDAALGPEALLVADGGDFVASAAYIVRPPGPLRWLDPGPFGTLGVGAGFALGAKLCRPEADVWVLFGDGALGYSLAEFDTFARHGLPVTAVVGNDGGWTQIAREQLLMLGDDVATVLAQCDYERAASGLGAAGFRLDDPELAEEVLAQARAAVAGGQPALVNALIGATDFRKGSISM